MSTDHTTRLLSLSRDLADRLTAGDDDAAHQVITALRARLDLVTRDLLPLPAADGELSEVMHG